MFGKINSTLCHWLPDHREEWSDGKPDEECCEESHPAAVERTHVWAFEAKKLDFSSFVILARVDVEMIGLILFDLGLHDFAKNS